LHSQNQLFGERKLRQLGRAVREARERKGISQAQLARNSRLSARAVREVEAGRSSPSLATIVAIVDALSIGLDELVAAARARRAVYGLLSAAEAGPYDRVLVTPIEQPRLRVRVVDAVSGELIVVPSGSIFAHILGGAATATLDGEQVNLRHGDSLHSRPGVLTGLDPQDGRVRMLLVEASGS
jgi:transcriptional regulator with XRE-family HTH domain